MRLAQEKDEYPVILYYGVPRSTHQLSLVPWVSRTRGCTGDRIEMDYREPTQTLLFLSSPGGGIDQESSSTSAPTMPSTQTPPAKLDAASSMDLPSAVPRVANNDEP